jgi:hypothetical protein
VARGEDYFGGGREARSRRRAKPRGKQLSGPKRSPAQQQQIRHAITHQVSQEHRVGASPAPIRTPRAPSPGTGQPVGRAIQKGARQGRRRVRAQRREQRLQRTLNRLTAPYSSRGLSHISQTMKMFEDLYNSDDPHEAEAGRKGLASFEIHLPKRDEHDTHVGPFNLEAELEGRGLLSKGAAKVGEFVEKQGPAALRTSGIPIPGGAAGRLVGRGMADVVNIAANTPTSAYGLGAAAVEAAQGRPQRAQGFARSFLKTDPFALAAQGKVGQAVKSVEEHPGFFAAELYGGGATLSRAAGRAARGGALGNAGRRYASQERAPAIVPHTDIAQVRRHPAGLFANRVSKATERRQAKKARGLYRQANRAAHDGDMDAAAELRTRAAHANPFRVKPSGTRGFGSHVKSAVDRYEGVSERVRRGHRSQSARAAGVGGSERVFFHGTDEKTAMQLRHTGDFNGRRRTEVYVANRPALAKEYGDHIVETHVEPKHPLDVDSPEFADVMHGVHNGSALAERARAAGYDALVKHGPDGYIKALDPSIVSVAKAGALPEKHAEVAMLLAQKIVHPSREDLVNYMHELEDAGKTLRGKSKRRANAKLVKAIRTTLEDKNLDLEQLAHHGDRYAALTGPLQDALVKRDILNKDAARMAKLIPYARRKMGAEFNHGTGQLELHGENLTADLIEAHMHAHGVDPGDVAFLSHHPSYDTAGAFYQSWHQPKGLKGGRRTGEAAVQGVAEHGPEAAQANVVRMQGLKDAFDRYAGFVKRFGYREGKAGGHGTLKEFASREDAVRFLRDTGRDGAWQPIALRPTFGSNFQGRAMVEAADNEFSTSVSEALTDALRGKPGAPRYALVPKEAAGRLAEHEKVTDATEFGRLWRSIMSHQKTVVLTTSGLSWEAGNVTEAALRTALKRAGPRSYALGRKTFEALWKIDPQMADDFIAQVGEGHFGMQELNVVHTTVERINGSYIRRVLHAAAKQPVAKQGVTLWNGLTRGIFHANGLLEHQFKVAMLGKYAKDFVIPEHGLRDLDAAAEQAARGLTGTNEQFAAAEWVRRAYGAYEGFSPSGRQFLMRYTAFGAWIANAAKFLGDVLPRDHPTTVALMAAGAEATRDWQRELATDLQPGWLKGSWPIGGNWFRVGRYTPFSAAGDPLGTAGGSVLPLFGGVQDAFRGLDWKGHPLYGAEKPEDVPNGQRFKAAVGSALDTFVPFLGLAKRTAKKPGSAPVKALHGLNPFDPIRRENPDLERKFAERRTVENRLAALRKTFKNGRKVNSENPTGEYTRLLKRSQDLNHDIHRLSKGKYGQAPSGTSGGGGGPKLNLGGGSGGSGPKLNLGGGGSAGGGPTLNLP